MKDKRFDDIVRSKLSDLKSDSAPQWNQFFEKKKAADRVENEMFFDKNIRNTVSKYRSDYNPKHWLMLKERIIFLASIRKKITFLKSFEIAAMSFIILIASINPLQKDLPNSSIPLAKVIEDESLSSTLAEEENQNSIHSLLSENNLAQNERQHNSYKIAKNKDRFDKQNFDRKNNDTVNLSSQMSDNKMDDDKLKSLNIILRSSDLEGKNSFQSKTEDSDITLMSKDSSFEPIKSSYDFPVNSRIEQLPIVDVVSEFENVQKLPASVLASDFVIKPYNPKSSWLHVFASFDNNMIFTPDDLAYNTTARKTEMFGFTVGVLYSRLVRKWEFETGVTTSTYSKPWDFTQQYGNFNGWYKYSFTNIDNNFIGIPLQTKYHFVQNSEWSIFGKTGLTSEFIVNSEYTSDNQYLGGIPIQIGMTPEIEETIAPFEEDHNFSDGIFQGGNLRDNLFVRAQIGLGIERNIMSNLSVYFSGEYQANIINREIGPNNDRINKVSFNVGFKMKLN